MRRTQRGSVAWRSGTGPWSGIKMSLLGKRGAAEGETTLLLSFLGGSSATGAKEDGEEADEDEADQSESHVNVPVGSNV